jgi:hypothetical protein
VAFYQDRSWYFLLLKFAKWWDRTHPNQPFESTYPIEHAPPVFNQSYNKLPAIKKTQLPTEKTYSEVSFLNHLNQIKPAQNYAIAKKHTKKYKPPAILHIEYIDADGQFTERDIRMTQYRKSQQWTNSVVAYCFLRSEERQFRFDRFVSCFDKETGEVIFDVKKFVNDFYS